MAFISSEDPSSLSKEKVRSGGPAIFPLTYQVNKVSPQGMNKTLTGEKVVEARQ